MMDRKYKIRSEFLAVLLSAASVLTMQLSIDVGAADTSEIQNPSTIVLGDLDGDTEVTEKDDQLFKEYFAGKEAVIPNFRAADVNEDGAVNRKDAMILARYLAEWDGYSLGKGEDSDRLPWEEAGAKQPVEYTWEEYEALSEEDKGAFFLSFADVTDFDAWLMVAQANAILPWKEPDAKQPFEYTWEEYETLSDFLKDAFFESFENPQAFEQWMKTATGNGLLPWEEAGAKQPAEYTWEEYEALSDEDKDAFFLSFADVTDFDAWLVVAQANAILPWKEPDAKQPFEYTWEEYEALSPFLQEKFFESFENTEDYNEWWENNSPD